MMPSLRVSVCKLVRSYLLIDYERGCDDNFYQLFERELGEKTLIFSGSFVKLTPENVWWFIAHNVYVLLTSAIMLFLSIFTCIYANVDPANAVLLIHMASVMLITIICHRCNTINRLDCTKYSKTYATLHSKLSFDNKSRTQHIALTFLKYYWPKLFWSSWSLYMICIPTYSYFINSNSYVLPFKLWFPFNTKNCSGFIAAYIFEIMGVNTLCLQVMTLIPFFYLISILIVVEYDTLVASLHSLHERSLTEFKKSWHSPESWLIQSTFDLYKEPEFIYYLERNFRQIILHHRAILSMIENVQKLSGDGVLAVLGFGALPIGASAYFLVSDIGDALMKVTFAIFFIIYIFIGGIICNVGQRIQSSGEELREELYFTNWYDWPDGMKRSLRIMLAKTLVAPALTATYFTITPNNDAFATMLNGAYTFVNLAALAPGSN